MVKGCGSAASLGLRHLKEGYKKAGTVGSSGVKDVNRKEIQFSGTFREYFAVDKNMNCQYVIC